MKKIQTTLALLIVLGFISTLVGGVGYVYGNPDGVTDYFDATNLCGSAECYIASKTNLVVTGGQVKLAEDCSSYGCAEPDGLGGCRAKAAGEQGQPACKRCDGTSLYPVNIANNTQDTEGSNLCNQTCKKCSGGSCVNQSSSEDLFNQCGMATGCTSPNCSGAGTFCGTSSITDSRDGKVYSTVQIGSQCWMKQGLNVGTRIAGSSSQGTSCSSIQKYCYGNSGTNCTSNNPNYPDGALYQWNQAMCGSTTQGAKGICPDGWHVPTDAQWCTLEQAVDSSITCSSTGWRGTDGGTKLKPNGSGGFEGNLTGYRETDGGFYQRGSYGYFWSSNQSGSNAWSRILDAGSSQVIRYTFGKAGGFSVRCLKD